MEALNGIRIIEMTEALAGPFCAMMLGDLGADVIKIERPGAGDMTRGWAPPYVKEESAYFMSVNRNKRGITLNLKDPEAQAILHRLIAEADVFMVNQPSLESLRRLRADPDTLRGINPRLIYCFISGFGMTGPEAGQGGYDVVAQARAGLMAQTGEPGMGPIRFPVPLADATCSLYCMIGILSALVARDRTGQGQVLDMALLDSQLAWMTHMAGAYFATGERPRKIGNAHATIVPYQPFRARDKYLTVAVGTERLWTAILPGAGNRRDCGRRSALRHQPGSHPQSRRADSTAGAGICDPGCGLLAGKIARGRYPLRTDQRSGRGAQ